MKNANIQSIRAIDLENRDFCFWMTGTYKFTADDILFVHDPAIPNFKSAATPRFLHPDPPVHSRSIIQ